MSEKASLAVESASSNSENPYDTLDSATLAAIAEAKNSIDQDSVTPNADLRTAVRESLETQGYQDAFKQVYNMNNLELNNFVAGAEQEASKRHTVELESIVATYDQYDTFAERRTALRELLEANGDTAAFKKLYNMNNLEITAFVNEARQELREVTSDADNMASTEASIDSEESTATAVSSQEATVASQASEEADDDPTSPKVQPLVPVFGNSVHIAVPPVPTFGPSVHIATPASIPAVPTFGPSVHIASPVEAGPSVEPALEGESLEEYEARQGVSDSESGPIDPNMPDDHAPEQGAATEKFDWKGMLKNPGGFAASRIEMLRRKLEHNRIAGQFDEHSIENHNRKLDNKSLRRIIGVTAGVAIAFLAYKAGSDIINHITPHSVSIADIPNGGKLGNQLGVDPFTHPKIEAPEGTGAWGGSHFSEAARTVTNGEGFNQTLQDLNIPESEWSSLVQKVGPKFAEQGWAYRMLDGSWGLSHTGQLPDDMLQYIQNSR